MFETTVGITKGSVMTVAHGRGPEVEGESAWIRLQMSCTGSITLNVRKEDMEALSRMLTSAGKMLALMGMQK